MGLLSFAEDVTGISTAKKLYKQVSSGASAEDIAKTALTGGAGATIIKNVAPSVGKALAPISNTLVSSAKKIGSTALSTGQQLIGTITDIATSSTKQATGILTGLLSSVEGGIEGQIGSITGVGGGSGSSGSSSGIGRTITIVGVGVGLVVVAVLVVKMFSGKKKGGGDSGAAADASKAASS